MIRMSWRPLVALAAALAMLSTPTQAGWEIGDMAEVMDSTLRLRGSSGSSDGMGGMLLLAIDEGGTPNRVSVSRVDHNGTEVWGDNGFWLPIIVGAVPYLWDTAVTHDGQGGGYFAFHDAEGGNDYLRLAHVDAAGTFQWTIPIDNLGPTGSVTDPQLKIVPTNNGNAILIFKRFTGGPILYSACVNNAGTILWHGPIQASWGWDSYALAKTDGLGGAFIAFWRNDTTDEVRVQRLNGTNGQRVWGTDGALVWSGPVGGVLDVVADYAGGGYLVRSDVGITYAQHVNSSGSKTWVSDIAVHDTQTAFFAISPQPKLCRDNAGGFIMYHGIENMYAQRVDMSGALLWGGGVTVATQVDVSCYRSLASDGLGGAVMTYENSWQIPSSSTYCDQTKGARVDAFGTLVWDEYLDICNWTDGGGGPVVHESPHTPRAFADGSGGGMFGWVIDDEGTGDRYLWGKGVDAAGNPPTARATFLVPDAAEPGQTGPYLILGDYLDLSLGYTLEKEDGSESLALTPTEFTSYQMVGGTATLTGLTRGPFHLQIDDGGTPVSTFEWAAGVGPPMSCVTDAPVIATPRDMRLQGSQRQAAYDDLGHLQVMFVEYDPGLPEYSLSWWSYDGFWAEHPSPLLTVNALSHPSMVAEPDGTLHVVVVLEIDATHDQLYYLRIDPDETVGLFDVLDPGEVIRNPVAAWTDDGLLHVVMERGASPGNDLFHVTHDGNNFSAGVNPTTNGSPRSPDLAAIGDSLELVWVSDSLIPGIQMVERAPYEGGGWHSPEMVSFGNIMSSPSVAADRDGAVLYAWIINNLAVTGIPALVHTQLRTDSEIYEPRARPGLAVHYRVSVAAAASGQFIMLTAEGDGGPDISITVREGDGRVFYPRVDANTGLDIGNPKLAANYGQSDVAAYWSGFDDPNEPVIGATCLHPVTSAPTPDVVVLDRRLRGHPNPFNPGTEFHFELARDSYVILELFDLRGRLVRELYRGELERGPQAIPWDGRDGNGVGLASGTYLARLKRHDGSVSVTKVALLK